MPPTAIRLSSLDVYRDGGSLSASFFDETAIEYTLLFPIQLSHHEPAGSKLRYYFPPILEKYIPVERVSPITGVANRDWKKESEPLSWEQARTILTTMWPLIATFETEYAWVYPEMVEIANTEGHPA